MIAKRSQPRDNAGCLVRQIRMAAERLTRINVGDVHLRKRDAHTGKRVPYRHAGVGVCPRVDDNPVRLPARTLHGIHNRAFVVALEVAQRHAKRGGGFIQLGRQAGKRLRTVKMRFARAEQVEVGAVDDENVHGYSFVWQTYRAFRQPESAGGII